ncbi:unnamed protein product [Rotaria socialis]|uniref:Uncharacterized protein n=2 Tax=Rotaria socialis TaxID=392032 RepID=A0A820T5Y9_9BILA|nr:unnamed protein product [Rotaria socialis]
MLPSLWSLNIRFNSLICSILSINNNLLNSGLVIARGLSYNKCCSILFPLILNSSPLSSSIQRIHFDGRNSSASDLCCEWLFNDENLLHFPNLKSLVLTQCGSIRSIVQTLLHLIQYQLDNLTLTFGNNVLQHMLYVKRDSVIDSDIVSVEFDCALCSFASWTSNVETLRQSKTNWFNKIPKLRYFSLKSFIGDDLDFIYLKWLLNNINYIEKLQLHIKNEELIETRCQNIWKSLIDANFIHQYCLSDIIPNLIYFDFYICYECQLPFNDIGKIVNSFKIHSFFIEHQWTNVKCLFDPITSCQHLFSSFTNTFQSSDSLINYSYICNWSAFNDQWFSLHPSPSLFLEQFNELSSNVSNINIYKNEILHHYNKRLNVNLAITTVEKNFRSFFTTTPKGRNEIREKVLAYLISVTVQLKYLLVERFEWLLHVVQYTSNELRTNALSTVQYAEFRLPSCYYGDNNAVSIGKHLVPFLSTYMPHLQTLRLWAI